MVLENHALQFVSNDSADSLPSCVEVSAVQITMRLGYFVGTRQTGDVSCLPNKTKEVSYP